MFITMMCHLVGFLYIVCKTTRQTKHEYSVSNTSLMLITFPRGNNQGMHMYANDKQNVPVECTGIQLGAAPPWLVHRAEWWASS